ncbi:hypothetical protein PVAP13_5NG625900 [Panicum virgatum]|uniref:Uncharacterized protein n=1 Tax=Panicum virgatum TaxID=38727 RepID=A0A8T0S560_PANVG|nr:hypothetical protein PVAP13_5NG625900 [Panicum virgatum]
MVGNDLPPATGVVKLYKSPGITSMRIYAPNTHVLDALRGSGIRLVLGVANEDLAGLASNRASAASWVRANVKPYYPSVNIAYIAVGNEVQGGATRSILPAMRNLAGVKVSTCVRLDVVTNSFPPSGGVLAQPCVAEIARSLATTGAPLLANVYPYFAYKEDPRSISLSYATFRPGTTVRGGGNGLVYTNLLDAIYAALEKAGAPNVRVVVSETGWPSAGGFAATVDNARRYNQAAIDHVRRGTPKRPGVQLETYVFAMFNEKQKPGEPTEKSFGLFHPNTSSALSRVSHQIPVKVSSL